MAKLLMWIIVVSFLIIYSVGVTILIRVLLGL